MQQAQEWCRSLTVCYFWNWAQTIAARKDYLLALPPLSGRKYPPFRVSGVDEDLVCIPAGPPGMGLSTVPRAPHGHGPAAGWGPPGMMIEEEEDEGEDDEY
jgi:hypothetical protein